MSRKIEAPVINTVEFYYGGTNKEFDLFLKNVIKDYISNDKLQPEETETLLKNQPKVSGLVKGVVICCGCRIGTATTGHAPANKKKGQIL